MKKTAIGARAALVAAAMAVGGNAVAAETESSGLGGLAFGVKAGTTGLGVEAVTGLTSMLNARAVVNFFDYDYDLDEDGVEYEAKLKLKSFGALLDFHPFKGTLRISGGLLSNGNKVGLNAICNGECDVGDYTIQGSNARLFGNMDFKSTAPYLGIGLGNAMNGTGFYGIFDVGVLFQGKPKVDLGAQGVADRVTYEDGTSEENVDLSRADIQAEVAKEEASLQDDVKKYKMYPVLSAGFGYRFF